jgi:4-diphosphocytidyl-2-C-methyl-D-erythritol kinase
MTIKSYAKVNIFLKIVGTRDNYHKILSRFMRVENLYDTISFEKKDSPSKEFKLIGDFGCKKEQNTIYKAYKLLPKNHFFDTHKVVVKKIIPEFAGLGGGSSNAAAFLNLANKVLELGFSKDKLSNMGAKIGADVPFFIYNYPSANVSGIGEIVRVFDEEPLNIKTITPKIECDTAKVYQKYRRDYLKNIDLEFAEKLSKLSSKDILDTYDAQELNDLFSPCLDIYNELAEYQKENWFFSGSGSTFFRIDNG